jgi:sodium/potassium-transporting ATPase subunit alpha
MKSRSLSGTILEEGSAIGITIHNGHNTIVGKLASSVMSTPLTETPIHADIRKFVFKISIIALITGVICFLIALRTYSVLENIVLSLGIIVGSVPEGLVPTTTLCLALSARRMLVKNVLIKRLEAIPCSLASVLSLTLFVLFL